MTTYIDSFDSIYQAAQAANNATACKGSRQQSTSITPRDDWDFSLGYVGAIDMGLNGGDWPEGAKELQSVSIHDAATTLAEVIEPSIVHDVTGGGLDIGEYLADNPECFFRVDDVEQTKPIMRIAVCAVPSANIESYQLMNHGRAIIALVEALELQQYSVELTAMCINNDWRHSKDIYRADVTIKQAGEPWSASSVAFALAHPAYSRRIGFRLVEAHKEMHKVTHNGYGRGDHPHPEGYQLFFPYIDTPYTFESPIGAMEYVKETVREQQPQLLAVGA